MKITWIIALVCVSTIAFAQTEPDTTYQVEITTTGSPVVSFFRHPRVPDEINMAAFGYGISVRALWHPARLLSIGFLTGYFSLAHDDIRVGSLEYSARLAAIPLQLALSMQKHGVEVGMGIGPYLMVSTIEGGHSAPSIGNRLELGMTFFGSYFFSISEEIKMGPEIRVLNFRYRGILSIMPSFSVRFNTMRY